MKIICIGRNYIDHAKELNNTVPDEPVFFMKPETALLRNNEPFYLPDFSDEIQYEIELVVKINKVGKHIAKEFAQRYYDEIGLGIDFTARDVQRILKEKGLPWEKAKAFDYSAVISSSFVKKNEINLNKIDFSLVLDKEEVQHGNSGNMIFDFDSVISYISKFVTLKIGDLIFTGTPSGVGKVVEGNNLQGFLNSLQMFDFDVK